MKLLKQDNGTAGLTILLSVITMLFVIGLLVMIFALMGGGLLATDTLYDSTTGSISNETLSAVGTEGENLSVYELRGVSCSLINITNATSVLIGSGNYTQTNCNLANSTIIFGGEDWFVNYDYTYQADSASSEVINATTASLSTVTDWFPLFIVITAMVVLILLTVIIITAIRSSGLMGPGSA